LIAQGKSVDTNVTDITDNYLFFGGTSDVEMETRVFLAFCPRPENNPCNSDDINDDTIIPIGSLVRVRSGSGKGAKISKLDSYVVCITCQSELNLSSTLVGLHVPDQVGIAYRPISALVKDPIVTPSKDRQAAAFLAYRGEIAAKGGAPLNRQARATLLRQAAADRLSAEKASAEKFAAAATSIVKKNYLHNGDRCGAS